MGGTVRLNSSQTDIVKAALVAVLVYTLIRALVFSAGSIDLLILRDNDDIMRFLSVREFLDGKGWYDKMHPRLAPPDGLNLHWSRILDAAQAGVISLFALFLPMERAEVMGILTWPTMLFVVLAVMTASVGRRVFGDLPAAIAVLFLAFWPILLVNYFQPLRLDHHNVQIVLGSAVVFCLILRGDAVKMGALAGLAAAFSLSVGLENLIILALAGMVLAIRAIADPREGSRRLLAYGATALATSSALFVVETPRHDWLSQTCDVLSAPVLGLLAASAVISGTYAGIGQRLASPGQRAVAMVVIAGVVLAATTPLWNACLMGPYGHLPETAQQIISGMIVEARPGYAHLAGDLGIAASGFPGLGAALCASLVLAYRIRTRQIEDQHEVTAVLTLLVIAWAGFFLALFYQVRLLVLSAPATPLLAGYSVAVLWRMRTPGKSSLQSLIFVGAVAVTVLGAQTFWTIGNLPTLLGGSMPGGAPDAASMCRHAAAMRSLNDLPTGRILAPMNYGAPILMLTEHEALAAPYHRNPDAMINGIVPFGGDEEPLREAISTFGADYVVLCSGGVYGNEDTFLTGLAAGKPAAGFETMTAHEDLVVLRAVGL